MYQDETLANPGQPDPKRVRKNWLENSFDGVIVEEASLKTSFSCLNGNFGSTSQIYENRSGVFNKFSADDLEKLNGIPCGQLLALANASGGCGGGGSVQTQQCGRINLLCDLNSPPQTVVEPPVGSSMQFTPLTPDQTKRINLAADKDDSTLVEDNQDPEKGLSEQTDWNETPQPKQKRRRKHRPKVVTEGKPKRGRRPATPKPPDGSSTGKRKYVRRPDGSSTGKRKYVRRKGIEKSTATPAVDDTSGVTHPNPDQQPKKTCKRKIDFDESEKRAEVVVDKTSTMSSEVVGDCQKVYETVSPSPITPSKTELPQGRLKTSYTNAKCKINFLQETHEKQPNHLPSPNECGCSTRVCSNVCMCYNSLESYLSLYTDYNSVSMHSTSINKKNGKAPEMSKDGYMQTYGRRLKKTKTMVHDSVSFNGYQQQYIYSMVPSLSHGYLGYTPNFRREIIYNIDALASRFEQLHISRSAVVPRYHEKNALVVYQQDRRLVPYEGLFNPMKRKKQRPKVDLDDETNRVWMLLLEDINSQGIDGTDEDKAKWWEEERRIFRGRADSFIARMHLVQGDRRFSQWKGSVLDSVVGVFLTQNVSDHLSSSAFMALAARYPLKQNTNGEPSHEEPCQVDESGDHCPIPMMLQEVNSCEEKEVVNSNEFSKSCVITVDLNDKLECEVAESFEKDSAICKESVINNVQVDEIASSRNSGEQKDGCKATVGSSTSFVELLHVQGTTKVYERKSVKRNSEKCGSEDSGLSAESASQTTVVDTISSQESTNSNCMAQQVFETTNHSAKTSKARENINIVEASGESVQKVVDFHLNKIKGNQKTNGIDEGSSKVKKENTGKTHVEVDWDKLRVEAEIKQKRERTANTRDSMDYEAIRKAHVDDVADAIKERGMNNRLAARIKDMLDRLVSDHGSTDLEWLRDVPPDKAKEYLLSFKGLGLKSVECIRLLTLHHLAFPVDTNVGRIAVRLGWVPLQALPESLQLHLLELYPIQESIQKYLWPRLCKLDQKTLYELHYQMITFGKVFCTKTRPNCNACPLRGECRHFASAFASARLALPAPQEGIASSTKNRTGQNLIGMIDLPSTSEQPKQLSEVQNCNPVIEEPSTPRTIVEVPTTPGPMVEVRETKEPIVEMPASPEMEQIEQEVFDLEDFSEDNEEIPMIKLNIEEFTQNLQTYMERHMELAEGDMSKALVALTSEAASIPAPKLKNVSQLRTEHQVYELPDSHPLLERLDTRENDDPCPYLLAIWTPGETPDSIQPPQGQCCSHESGTLCNQETCFFCNSTREANNQTVRGTILIPCRTATRGSFPLNGTYFQVNEVFADHESSLNPIDVPRTWLWNLPKRTVYFGTSIPSIFKGLTTEQIQYCFWRGFVCVRGFDRKERAPRPLRARLHFPASRLKTSTPKTDEKEKLTR